MVVQGLLLPRRKPWRLCYDGVEMVGVLREELNEEVGTEGLVGYSKDTRLTPGGGVRKLRGGWARRCWQAGGWQGKQCISVCRLL